LVPGLLFLFAFLEGISEDEEKAKAVLGDLQLHIKKSLYFKVNARSTKIVLKNISFYVHVFSIQINSKNLNIFIQVANFANKNT